MKANRVLLLRGALVWILVVAGAANVAQAQVFARLRQAKSARRFFPRRPTRPCRFPRSSLPRPLFRTVVTRRQLNADARIKIRAIAAFVKRIDGETRPTAVIWKSRFR